MHPIENLRYVARANGVPSGELVREAAMSLDWLGATGPDLVIACRRILERQPLVGRLWWLAASLLAASDRPDYGAGSPADDLVDALDRDPTARHLAQALPDDATIVTIGRPDTVGDALARRGDVRVLCADSQHEASSFLRRLERVDIDAEPVPGEYLARAVAIADVVVIEALAVSEQTTVAPVGSQVLAAVATQARRPVWLVAPLGTRLPRQYVDAIAAAVAPPDADAPPPSLPSSSLQSSSSSLAAESQPWEIDVDVFATDVITHLAVGDGLIPAGPPGGAASPFVADCAFLPELLARRRDSQPTNPR